jgi:hypothetical protein
MKTSMAAGAVIAIIAWARFGPAPAAAFVAGCAWSLANLYLLRALVGSVFHEPERRKLKIAALLVVKVPVLYGLGYVLLLWGRLPVGALLAGFAWPLCVIVLKAAGRLIMGLDRPDRAPGPGGHLRTNVPSPADSRGLLQTRQASTRGSARPPRARKGG